MRSRPSSLTPHATMAAMKAMKAAKAMKAMKAMKAKRVSKIAKGKRARAVVFNGTKEKTYTGLKKTDLMKTKTGRIVTKKAHAAGKRNPWAWAVWWAYKALGIKGFQALKKGSPLYTKAMEFHLFDSWLCGPC